MDQMKITQLLSKSKNIVFIGAPGSGKGTYAKRLAPFIQIPHISSGDLIRAEIKGKTSFGQQVEAIAKRGDLISDELLLSIIESRLSKDDARDGFILDGVPRSLPQLRKIDAIRPIDLVIEIVLREDIILEKALARRACAKCNEQYNLFSIETKDYRMPALAPKRDGMCDKCDGKLVARSDDNREVIQKRLDLYKEYIGPIRKEYERRGIVQKFELKLGVHEMWPIMKEAFSGVKINKNN